MSLINKLEDHIAKGIGLVEIVKSECDFKQIRSELLIASLNKLTTLEVPLNTGIFASFSSIKRYILIFNNTPRYGPK